MSGKFNFSLTEADATARQFADLQRDVKELAPSIVQSITPMVEQIKTMYADIKTLTDNLDARVKESIDANSYTRDEIDAKDQEWNWGTLAPARGGTGTTNAYSNVFSTGSWRATWSLSDGTLGTAQSVRSVKTDICDADNFLDVAALRKVKWQIYRMIADVNLNGDDAVPHIGMIADDFEDAGLGFFCEYDESGELVGLNYPMLGVAALRLAQDAEERLDKLEAIINTSKDK